ncbi:MAG: hypothetical protein R2749_29570 [Acidimicrobiales bacterium]
MVERLGAFVQRGGCFEDVRRVGHPVLGDAGLDDRHPEDAAAVVGDALRFGDAAAAVAGGGLLHREVLGVGHHLGGLPEGDGEVFGEGVGDLPGGVAAVVPALVGAAGGGDVEEPAVGVLAELGA